MAPKGAMTGRRARIAAAMFLCLVPSNAALAGLIDYVRRPDPASRWELGAERDVRGAATLEANLVSQTWRGRPWSHGLRLTRPAALRHPDVAVLIIGGDERYAFVDEQRLAAASGAVVALLRNVPNQPLFGRYEDDLISYTFEQYLRSEEPDWPLLLPMTKAAVRAIDAIAEIAASRWGLQIRRFVVTGASKRGWTSWLTAVADPRVVGVVPVVFDNLNIGEQLENQYAVWRRYSSKLGDYTEKGLPAFVATERGRRLLSIVDPYAYRSALERTSKLLVNGTNDPYWELNAVNFYWNDLPGAKALLEIPNGDHDAGSDDRLPPTLAELVERASSGRALPELRWDDGTRPAVLSSEAPATVWFWHAESASRDFRSAHWQRLPSRREGERFVADAAATDGRHSAWFAEARYATPGGGFALSTPVRIGSSPPGG